MPGALGASQVTPTLRAGSLEESDILCICFDSQEHSGKGFRGTFSLVPATVLGGSNGVLGSSAVGKVGETEAQFLHL